jgi:hypothetical protein
VSLCVFSCAAQLRLLFVASAAAAAIAFGCICFVVASLLLLLLRLIRLNLFLYPRRSPRWFPAASAFVVASAAAATSIRCIADSSCICFRFVASAAAGLIQLAFVFGSCDRLLRCRIALIPLHLLFVDQLPLLLWH